MHARPPLLGLSNRPRDGLPRASQGNFNSTTSNLFVISLRIVKLRFCTGIWRRATSFWPTITLSKSPTLDWPVKSIVLETTRRKARYFFFFLPSSFYYDSIVRPFFFFFFHCVNRFKSKKKKFFIFIVVNWSSVVFCSFLFFCCCNAIKKRVHCQSSGWPLSPSSTGCFPLSRTSGLSASFYGSSSHSERLRIQVTSSSSSSNTFTLT